MTQFCTIRSAFEEVRNGTESEDDMFLYPFSDLKRCPGRDRINGTFKSVPYWGTQTSKLMVKNQADVSICPISKRSGKETHVQKQRIRRFCPFCTFGQCLKRNHISAGALHLSEQTLFFNKKHPETRNGFPDVNFNAEKEGFEPSRRFPDLCP